MTDVLGSTFYQDTVYVYITSSLESSSRFISLAFSSLLVIHYLMHLSSHLCHHHHFCHLLLPHSEMTYNLLSVTLNSTILLYSPTLSLLAQNYLFHKSFPLQQTRLLVPWSIDSWYLGLPLLIIRLNRTYHSHSFIISSFFTIFVSSFMWQTKLANHHFLTIKSYRIVHQCVLQQSSPITWD